jgi:hypothetical protein
MSEDEFLEHCAKNDGYCTYCKEWTAFGGVEPDARRYECSECGRMRVYGAEEALLKGVIEIGSDGDDE